MRRCLVGHALQNRALKSPGGPTLLQILLTSSLNHLCTKFASFRNAPGLPGGTPQQRAPYTRFARSRSLLFFLESQSMLMRLRLLADLAPMRKYGPVNQPTHQSAPSRVSRPVRPGAGCAPSAEIKYAKFDETV